MVLSFFVEGTTKVDYTSACLMREEITNLQWHHVTLPPLPLFPNPIHISNYLSSVTMGPHQYRAIGQAFGSSCQ